MARDSEKAKNLFNRWTDFKAKAGGGAGGGNSRAPIFSTECTSLPDAEKWRRDMVRDITKKVTAIGNASLGEHRLRELNDEINKLMKKKRWWEARILELGGPDHRRVKQFYDVDGKEVQGAPGYRYYGAAKDLPGVRELIVVDSADSRKRLRQEDRRTRADISKGLTPEYYGSFGGDDGDGGQLAAKEAEREAQLIRQAVQDWAVRKRRVVEQVKRTGAAVGKEELDLMEATDDVEKAVSAALLSSSSSSSSAAPSEEDLVAQKKADFLAKLGL